MTFVELQVALLADGYRKGRPPRFGLHDEAMSSADIVADVHCERCDHVGHAYRPLFRPTPRDAVAIAVCPRGSGDEEF